MTASAIALATLACDNRQHQPNRHPTPEGPLRIVTLSVELSELLIELGLASEIVAVDSASRKLPELATRVDLGDSARVDADAIASLKPNFVFALGEDDENLLAGALEARGIPIHRFGPVTANEVIQAIHEIGVIVARPDSANALIRRWTDEISSIAMERDRASRLQVVWILDRDPLTVVGSEGLLHEMLELAGGEMAQHALRGERVESTLDAIVASAPDVILDSSPESSRDPIAIAVRTEALPTSMGELPTMDLLNRVRILHGALYAPR